MCGRVRTRSKRKTIARQWHLHWQYDPLRCRLACSVVIRELVAVKKKERPGNCSSFSNTCNTLVWPRSQRRSTKNRDHLTQLASESAASTLLSLATNSKAPEFKIAVYEFEVRLLSPGNQTGSTVWNVFDKHSKKRVGIWGSTEHITTLSGTGLRKQVSNCHREMKMKLRSQSSSYCYLHRRSRRRLREAQA